MTSDAHRFGRARSACVLVLALFVASCGRVEPAPPPAPPAHAPDLPALSSLPGWCELGTFVVESGTLAVCDPGYGAPGADEVESGALHGLARNAKRGEWHASVIKVDAGDWGERCSELVAHHTDHQPTTGATWQLAASAICVDSGQAGIFDAPTIGLDSIVPQGWFDGGTPLLPDELWYSMCCKQTLSDLGAGVVPGGAVASAGFGDGTYEWFHVTTGDGTVVAVRIVFLTDEDLK